MICLCVCVIATYVITRELFRKDIDTLSVAGVTLEVWPGEPQRAGCRIALVADARSMHSYRGVR
jgi:hypothetical protein